MIPLPYATVATESGGVSRLYAYGMTMTDAMRLISAPGTAT